MAPNASSSFAKIGSKPKTVFIIIWSFVILPLPCGSKAFVVFFIVFIVKAAVCVFLIAFVLFVPEIILTNFLWSVVSPFILIAYWLTKEKMEKRLSCPDIIALSIDEIPITAAFTIKTIKNTTNAKYSFHTY